MRKAFAALLVLLSPSLLTAQQATVTPNLHLNKPVNHSLNWSPAVNANFDTLDSILSGGVPLPPSFWNANPGTVNQAGALKLATGTGSTAENASMKGQPNGYAPLGADGTVPQANLPAAGSLTAGQVNALSGLTVDTTGSAGKIAGTPVSGTANADSVLLTTQTNVAQWSQLVGCADTEASSYKSIDHSFHCVALASGSGGATPAGDTAGQAQVLTINSDNSKSLSASTVNLANGQVRAPGAAIIGNLSDPESFGSVSGLVGPMLHVGPNGQSDGTRLVLEAASGQVWEQHGYTPTAVAGAQDFRIHSQTTGEVDMDLNSADFTSSFPILAFMPDSTAWFQDKHVTLGTKDTTPSTNINGYNRAADSIFTIVSDPNVATAGAGLYLHSNGSGDTIISYGIEANQGAVGYGTGYWESGLYGADDRFHIMNLVPGQKRSEMTCVGSDGTADQGKCLFDNGWLGAFAINTVNPFAKNPNGTQWSGSYVDVAYNTSPEFALATKGTGNPSYVGLDVNTPYAFGGYNEFNPAPGASNFFKSNYAGIIGTFTWQAQGQHQIMPMAANCWGVGDCIGGEETLIHHGGGVESAAEQVHGRRTNIQEDPNTAIATCSGSGCTTGSTTFGLASGQYLNTLGEGHYMADLSASTLNAGRIANSAGQDGATLLQRNTFTNANFPVSQLFQTAAAVPAAAGASPAPGLVTFAIKTSGVPAGYLTSLSGVPATGLACTYDGRGSAGQIGAKYTVIDSTHLQANLRVGLSDSSMIALNGMCGYGIDPLGDQVVPQQGNMLLHAIVPTYASVDAETILNHSIVHLGTNSGGHGQYTAGMTVVNFVRSGGVATFDLEGFRPDQMDRMTVTVGGNDSNVGGVTLPVTLVDAGGLKAGVSHFTAPDTRADYTAPSASFITASVDNSQFAVVPIAETLDVRNTGAIVVGDNVMPLNSGDTIIQTHTEVMSIAAVDQDTVVNFSPQQDAPSASHGCDYAGEVGAFMNVSQVCYAVYNNTADSETLGFGGRHPAPGAQFVQTGHASGNLDLEIDRFGTVIGISPSNDDLAHFGQIHFVDFKLSPTIGNTIDLIPSLNPAFQSRLAFNIHSSFSTAYAPIYNVGADGATQVTISAQTGTGTYTTAATYPVQPVCSVGSNMGAPVNFNGIGQTWTTGNGMWTVTLTAGTKPVADTVVTMSCAEPGQTYLN